MLLPGKMADHSSTTIQENRPISDQDGALQARPREALERPGPVKKASGLKGGPLKKKGVVFSAKPQVGTFQQHCTSSSASLGLIFRCCHMVYHNVMLLRITVVDLNVLGGCCFDKNLLRVVFS